MINDVSLNSNNSNVKVSLMVPAELYFVSPALKN